MKEITGKELQELQLQILDYIDNICCQNNLDYYLDAGTLLGAVRHKGFIPWDDDIDLLMPRKDYEKLFDLLKNDKRYPMISYKNDDNYILPFGKVYDNQTTIQEKVVGDVKYGVFIDVVPYDNLPDGKITRYIYQTYMRFLSVFYRYKAFKYQAEGIKGKLIKRIAEQRTVRSYILELDHSAQKYNNQETKYVWYQVFTYVPYAKIERDVFKKSIRMQFEDRKYPVPVGYDKRLKLAYGDYMKLPPKEKQVKTHTFRAYWR